MKEIRKKNEIPPGYFTPYDHPDWRVPTAKTLDERHLRDRIIFWIFYFMFFLIGIGCGIFAVVLLLFLTKIITWILE